MGHWIQKEIDILVREDPTDPESEMIPSGRTRFVWENPKTGQVSDELPPQIVVTRNKKRPRLHKVTTKADMTKNEYKRYYEKEMGEINLNRAKVKSSILIQRIYRGYRCRVFYAKHKIRWYASIHVERVVKGFSWSPKGVLSSQASSSGYKNSSSLQRNARSSMGIPKLLLHG